MPPRCISFSRYLSPSIFLYFSTLFIFTLVHVKWKNFRTKTEGNCKSDKLLLIYWYRNRKLVGINKKEKKWPKYNGKNHSTHVLLHFDCKFLHIFCYIYIYEIDILSSVELPALGLELNWWSVWRVDWLPLKYFDAFSVFTQLIVCPNQWNMVVKQNKHKTRIFFIWISALLCFCTWALLLRWVKLCTRRYLSTLSWRCAIVRCSLCVRAWCCVIYIYKIY